jgi:hypothetical protein
MELPISSMLTLRIDTWRDARILADDLSLWVFRGQENAEWDLSTGIQRAGTLGKVQSLMAGRHCPCSAFTEKRLVAGATHFSHRRFRLCGVMGREFRPSTHWWRLSRHGGR